jgi:hypothetical protein
MLQELYMDISELLVLNEAMECKCCKLGEKHPHTLESIKNLVDLYESWDKPEQAEQWRAKLPREQVTEEQ